KYFGSLTIVLMLGMVGARIFLLRRHGTKAMRFGDLDKKDFLIPPFAFFYFYLVFANTFGWPTVSTQEFFRSETIRWIGVLMCAVGLLLVLGSLVSFGRSFRVGIDMDRPDRLITCGVFAFSRNPIYVAFACILMGQFLVSQIGYYCSLSGRPC